MTNSVDFSKYKSRKALLKTILREVESRPRVYNTTTEPKYSDYSLTEEDANKVNIFNAAQEVKRWRFVKYYFIFFGTLSIVSFFDVPEIFNIAWFFILFIPFNFIGLFLITGEIYKNHPLTKNIEQYNKDIEEYFSYLKSLERNFWVNLSGYDFEKEVGKLLKCFFNDVRITRGSGDGGVDIILNENNTKNKIIIQCKNHKNKIGPEPVRALYGVMKNFKASKAVMIARSAFSQGSINFYENNSNIYLYDLENILSWKKSDKINFAGNIYERFKQ